MKRIVLTYTEEVIWIANVEHLNAVKAITKGFEYRLVHYKFRDDYAWINQFNQIISLEFEGQTKTWHNSLKLAIEFMDNCGGDVYYDI